MTAYELRISDWSSYVCSSDLDEQVWVAVVIQWTMAIAGFLIGRFIAPRWRQTGVLTAAEFMQQRFGSGVHKFYTYVLLLMSVAFNGAFLSPEAKLVDVSTGLPSHGAILLFGLMAVLYNSSGGTGEDND